MVLKSVAKPSRGETSRREQLAEGGQENGQDGEVGKTVPPESPTTQESANSGAIGWAIAAAMAAFLLLSPSWWAPVALALAVTFGVAVFILFTLAEKR